MGSNQSSECQICNPPIKVLFIYVNNCTLRKSVEVNKECVVCMSVPYTHVITTCGHKCMCYNCGKKLTKCPICQKGYDHKTQFIEVFEV